MENYGVPIEIFLKILQLLPHRQLLISKQVNRRWYSIIDGEFRFKELALSNTSHFNQRWYPIYEPISPDCLIKIACLKRCDLQTVAFTKLKHLYLYTDNHLDVHLDTNRFDIGKLVNHLDQLETLEVVGWITNVQKDSLALANLRTLNIDQFQFDHLTVDCPLLTKLRMKFAHCGLFNDIEFKHPKSVRSLKVEQLGSRWVEMFSELEELYLDYIYNIGDELLKELPKLREIHFDTHDLIANYESLSEQKHRYKRSNFLIYYHGLEFDMETLLENVPSWHFPKSEFVYFIHSYYPELVDQNQIYVHSINLNTFEDSFTDGIPEELIRRLVNLRALKISREVRDAQQLINILDSLGGCLSQLEIESSSLDQHIFDLLPKRCPVLDLFTVNERRPIDPSFILDFHSLKSLTFLQIVLTKELVEAVFRKYENLKLFNFNYKKGRVTHRIRLNRLSELKEALDF